MNAMSPQPRGTLSNDDRFAILKWKGRKAEAETRLRLAVLKAAENGASVRELAAFTGLSTNTISRWKRDK